MQTTIIEFSEMNTKHERFKALLVINHSLLCCFTSQLRSVIYEKMIETAPEH